MLGPLFRGEPCHPEIEFPNLFEGMEDARGRLDRAVQGVLGRLTIPILVPGEPLRQEPAFLFLQKELGAMDPKVRALAGGGMVRASLGFVYAQMHQGVLDGVGPEQILERIAKDGGALTELDVRGVGSDIDLYLKDVSTDFAALKARAEEMVSGVFDVMKDHVISPASVKKTLLLLADVLRYEKEVQLSRQEGGSALDWLAFDVERGCFIQPEGHPGIVDRFLRGTFDYEASLPGHSTADAPKQTLRGLRTLLEISFLKPSTGRLLDEVVELERFVRLGGALSHRVRDQLDKLVRNQRCGAGRRFDAPLPGSLDDAVAALGRALGPCLYPGSQRQALPRFLPRYPLGEQRQAEFNQLRISGPPSIPESLYAAVDPEQVPAICRAGLLWQEAGAIIGEDPRDFLNSPDAVRVPIKFRQDVRPNILNWETAKDTRGLQALALECGGDEGALLEKLVREHGVDAIRDGSTVRVLNGEAVSTPSGRFDVAAVMGSRLERPRQEIPFDCVHWEYGEKIVNHYRSEWDAAAGEFFPLFGLAYICGEKLPGPKPLEYLVRSVEHPGFQASPVDRILIARRFASFLKDKILTEDVQDIPPPRLFLKMLWSRGEPLGMHAFGPADTLFRELGFQAADYLDVILAHWKERFESEDPWTEMGELLSWKANLSKELLGQYRSDDPALRLEARATVERAGETLGACASRLGQPADVDSQLSRLEVYAGLWRYTHEDVRAKMPPLRPLVQEILKFFADPRDARTELKMLRAYGSAFYAMEPNDRVGLPDARELGLVMIEEKLNRWSSELALTQEPPKGWTQKDLEMAKIGFRDETLLAGVGNICRFSANDHMKLLLDPRFSSEAAGTLLAEPLLRRAEHEPDFASGAEAWFKERGLPQPESFNELVANTGPRRELGSVAPYYNRAHVGVTLLMHWRSVYLGLPESSSGPEQWMGAIRGVAGRGYYNEVLQRLKDPELANQRAAEGFRWRGNFWSAKPLSGA